MLGQSVVAMGAVEGVVQVFTGLGDGTLNTPVAASLASGGALVDLYAGTFTGTTIPDLVSLSTTADSLVLFKNSGTPSLTRSTIAYNSTTPVAQLIAAGDLNGDGYTDVISARKSGTNYFVTVTYSSLSTTPSEQYDTSFSTVAFVDLAAVDVNRDGRSDAVAVDSSGLLHVWYGQATKAAPVENGKMILSAGTLFNQLAVGDFDGDGYGDIAAMNKMPASLYIYSGAAGGLVAMPQKVEIESINNDDIAVGDINGDGRSDILLLRGLTTSPLQLFPYLATCL